MITKPLPFLSFNLAFGFFFLLSISPFYPYFNFLLENSNFLTIYVSIYVEIYLSIYIYIYLSIYLYIYLCIDISIYVSMYRYIYLCINLCINLSINLSTCQSPHLSIYLSIYLSYPFLISCSFLHSLILSLDVTASIPIFLLHNFPS